MAPDILLWNASQSKPFARTAVMMLVDEDKLDLDKSVTEYLPELNHLMIKRVDLDSMLILERVSQPVTLRRLLSHISLMEFVTGVQQQMGKIDILPLNWSVCVSNMTHLKFKPGNNFSYSNKGINIAATIVERVMDNVRYSVSVNWSTKADMLPSNVPHFFRLVPRKNKKMEFVCEFTKESVKAPLLTVSESIKSSINGCKSYWESGAAIDLSESTDPRWKELERKIVLSQYLMKANEAGTCPPKESELVNNGWYRRFHFEMFWWHGVHYALWDRWPLFDKSLHVISDFLPRSIKRAKKQGYKGARWPICTADFDRNWPHPIHATLIWQQPHPIYFAELDYRLHPTQATLDKWKDVVFETADFMADFAFYDENTKRYVLGPPVFIVSENTDPKATINPAFEIGYWKFGLRVAQTWKEQLSLPHNAKWDDVLKKMSPLPVEDGV